MTWNKKWLLGVGLPLVAVAGIFLGFYGVRRQLADYRAQLRAKGVKLTVAEIVPPWPAPEENAGQQLALLCRNLGAAAVLPEDLVGSMRLVAPGRARVAWRQAAPFDLPLKKPAHTNWTWGMVGDTLDADLDLLAEIREVLARPHLDLGLDYFQGFSLLLPHLARHKALAQQLARTVLFQLHAGELAAVADNLHALITLAGRQSEEPLMISQLVQMAIAQIGLAVTWEALQAPGWQEPQLARLQRDWESLNFALPMKRAAGMERAMMLVEFERARQSLKALDQMMDSGGQSGPEGLARGVLWQWYGSYPDERHYLEIMERVSACFDELQEGTPFAPILARQKSFFADLTQRASNPKGGPALGFLLSRNVASSWENIPAKIAYVVSMRRLAATAVAWERYRLVKGQPPPDLAALVPAFLAAVPLDPMDGRPLRYHPGPPGAFLLYTVGEDGRDDGGDGHPATTNSNYLSLIAGKDWVWPAVATPEDLAAEAQKKR